jgi:hypothetical protein
MIDVGEVIDLVGYRQKSCFSGAIAELSCTLNRLIKPSPKEQIQQNNFLHKILSPEIHHSDALLVYNRPWFQVGGSVDPG